jgi:hypothetical protein
LKYFIIGVVSSPPGQVLSHPALFYLSYQHWANLEYSQANLAGASIIKEIER